ncbi:hypothetical protein JJ691_33110 [Kutzneria sp. CA-103260]|nr:hypothetical protein JJ691_33110 [Kutzneria sp. CA-103260]
MLYARSRQVPVAAAGLVAVVVGVWLLYRNSWSVLPASLAITGGVAIAAIGLSGQDVDLDRTAAIRWPVRRLAHLLLIGVVTGVLVLAAQQLGGSPVDTWLVVRNSAGVLGLAGLAATLAGGHFGWTLPLFWFAVAVVVPESADPPVRTQVVAWMLQPGDSAPANWTAMVAAMVGLVAYTWSGGRK